MNDTKPALPEPFDWCYEWDGPYGTRKFSAASHNGMKPARSVPIYRPDQMHAYADQRTAAAQARIAELNALLTDARDMLTILAKRYTLTILDNDSVREVLSDLNAALASTSGAEPAECLDNDSPWLVCKPCNAAGQCQRMADEARTKLARKP